MIITYPIQLPYVMDKEQRIVPDPIYNDSEILSGSYPMGKNRYWHGGVHIHPGDRSTPIRAIADGEVVAYRYDDVDSKDEFFDKNPYSRSFVLLKHETELGQTSLGISRVTFYSLYMHLRSWSEVKDMKGNLAVQFLRKAVQEPPTTGSQKYTPKSKVQEQFTSLTANGSIMLGSGLAHVQRGDVLGYCGSIPDNFSAPSRGIHFEIFFDDITYLSNPYKTLWGRCTLEEALLLYEELQEKQTVKVDATKPLTKAEGHTVDGFVKVEFDRHYYWISEDQLQIIDIHSPKLENGTKEKYFSKGNELQAYTKDPSKNIRKLPKGAAIVPWCAPWLNTDEFREETFDAKSWIQVFAPDTNKIYWAEKSTIKYTSDADWPTFHTIEEHGKYSSDGFIDDEGMLKLLNLYETARTTNKNQRLTDNDNVLHYLISKHPTEWSKRDLTKRYGRLMQDGFGPQKLSPEQFQNLVKHIERLSFWDEIPTLPCPDGVWHAHPIKFIEHLSRCLWLTSAELKKIYPDEFSLTPETISHGTKHTVRETYRTSINKCFYKFAVNNRMRQAHFLGQGAIESGSLNKMEEIASGEAYEGRLELGNISPGDGPKFKGRGFKQLTGRYNYAEYWSYRGWLKKGVDFSIGWERGTHKNPPIISDPKRISRVSFDCIDIGTWFCILLRPNVITAMDKDDIRAVTHGINGGADTKNWEKASSFADRVDFTQRIKKVLI